METTAPPPPPHPEPAAPAPRIAAVGMASWDTLLAVPRYPEAGADALVDQAVSLPGGTTTNTAVALARLGARVAIAAAVGDDAEGDTIRRALAAEGVDAAWLTTRPGERTDHSTVIVSADPLDRTIFWQRGAELKRGDRLPVEAILGHDAVVLDVADPALRRFLLDLPAHTLPRTRLVGTVTYLLAGAIPDALALALRHDVIVGNEREMLALTGTWTVSDATAALRARMRGENLRAAVITRGADGCRIVTEEGRWRVPAFSVPVVDPTGAGDAFVAGVAYGVGRRWDLTDWRRIGRFANAVAGLAIRALGAQSALPTLAEVDALMSDQPWPSAAPADAPDSI